jgi:hypothetical protein
MLILSIYLGSLQKSVFDHTIFVSMRDAAIFRCAIVGSSLIAVPFNFFLSYFLRVGLQFLAWLYFCSSICGKYRV